MQKNIWKQWDKQEQVRAENRAFVELNNLFLQVERGSVLLTITLGNKLRILLSEVYPNRCAEQVAIDYWMSEFAQLPNWNNV